MFSNILVFVSSRFSTDEPRWDTFHDRRGGCARKIRRRKKRGGGCKRSKNAVDHRLAGGNASREYIRPPLGESVSETVTGPVRR